MDQVTIFWRDGKTAPDSEEQLPPVTQDALSWGPAGNFFAIQDSDGMFYFFPAETIDVVAVAPARAPEAPAEASPEAASDTSGGDDDTPKIVLPTPGS